MQEQNLNKFEKKLIKIIDNSRKKQEHKLYANRKKYAEKIYKYLRKNEFNLSDLSTNITNLMKNKYILFELNRILEANNQDKIYCNENTYLAEIKLATTQDPTKDPIVYKRFVSDFGKASFPEYRQYVEIVGMNCDIPLLSTTSLPEKNTLYILNVNANLVTIKKIFDQNEYSFKKFSKESEVLSYNKIFGKDYTKNKNDEEETR